tara:strand:+ start:610 stop:1737 length:1128 start_codon:yes stop_codon:yes gene_type:complete
MKNTQTKLKYKPRRKKKVNTRHGRNHTSKQHGGKKSQTRRIPKKDRIKVPKEVNGTMAQCSPYSRKNRLFRDSCFSKETLDEIVKGFNSQYKDDHIDSKQNSTQLRKQLNEKLPQKIHCTDDMCWIDKLIMNSSTKTKIKEQLFRPQKPEKWISEPNKWLTNHDIQNVLNQYNKAYPEFHFIGPSPLDYDTKPYETNCVCNRLCNFSLEKEYKKGIRKIGITFNEDTHEKSGSHWVSFFIDLDDQFIMFFDSAGNTMLAPMKRFQDTVVDQGTKFFGKPFRVYRNHHEHQKRNTECGMYSLYFIIAMLLRKIDILQDDKHDNSVPDVRLNKVIRGGTLNKMPLDDLLYYFTKQRIPDKFVHQYRDLLFSSLGKNA